MMTGMFSSPHERPDGIECRIVHGEARAVGLLVAEAQLLEDLQPDGAVLHRLRADSSSAFCSQPGPPAPSQATFAKTRKRSLYGLALIASTFVLIVGGIAAAGQIHEHAQVERVHLLDPLARWVARVRRAVRVDVDDGELRFRHEVLRRRRRSNAAGSRRCSAAGFAGAWQLLVRTSVIPGGHSSPSLISTRAARRRRVRPARALTLPARGRLLSAVWAMTAAPAAADHEYECRNL